MQNEEPLAPFTEEIEVAGAELAHEIDRLLAGGEVVQLQLRSEKGDLNLTLPHADQRVDARWAGVVESLSRMLPKLTIRVARTGKDGTAREARHELVGAE